LIPLFNRLCLCTTKKSLVTKGSSLAKFIRDALPSLAISCCILSGIKLPPNGQKVRKTASKLTHNVSGAAGLKNIVTAKFPGRTKIFQLNLSNFPMLHLEKIELLCIFVRPPQLKLAIVINTEINKDTLC
jgi:hypothetical protein